MMGHDLTITTSDSLKADLTYAGNKVVVKFRGLINEDTNFGILLDTLSQTNATQVEIDLGGVTRMNSCGVREWILFVERLQCLKSISYQRLNEIFVDQANMIPNILGKKGTQVYSVEAPFYCDACEFSTIQLIRLEEIYSTDGGLDLKEFKCPHCHRKMEVDAILSEYFGFLRYAKIGKTKDRKR